MVTVIRAHGLHVCIYMDDHEPAHVHVIGDGKAKINLDGPDGAPEVVQQKGMTFVEARRAKQIVEANREFLLGEWRRIHG